MLKENSRTRIFIPFEEMCLENREQVEEKVLSWLKSCPFSLNEQYGKNYYIHKSYWYGTVGFQYDLKENGDLEIFTHYNAPQRARALTAKSASSKTVNGYRLWISYLFRYLKGDKAAANEYAVYFTDPRYQISLPKDKV